jgi:DNA helicase II / ATP-dependent DNA helicase PcrA
VVRPLPSPPKPAARLGSLVHRLLERRARNLPDLVDAGDLGDEGAGGAVAPDLVERATRNFAATPYASQPSPDAEVAVVLRVGPWVVRGRIDAVFRGPDGVELVDWKTGSRAAPAADGLDQLGIYALALRELGELPAGACRAAYCYLGGEEPAIQSRMLGPVELDRQRELLEAALQALGRGDYQRACGRPDCDTCRRDGRGVNRPTAPR